MRRVPVDPLRQKVDRALSVSNEIDPSCIAKRLECVKLASALSRRAKAEASFTHSKRFAKFEDQQTFDTPRRRAAHLGLRRSFFSFGFGIFLGFGVWGLEFPHQADGASG